VTLALLALGTPAARASMQGPQVETDEDRRTGQARPEPRLRDVTTAIATLAAQFRETSVASLKSR
jgi:hypothetical protein